MNAARRFSIETPPPIAARLTPKPLTKPEVFAFLRDHQMLYSSKIGANQYSRARVIVREVRS